MQCAWYDGGDEGPSGLLCRWQRQQHLAVPSMATKPTNMPIHVAMTMAAVMRPWLRVRSPGSGTHCEPRLARRCTSSVPYTLLAMVRQ